MRKRFVEVKFHKTGDQVNVCHFEEDIQTQATPGIFAHGKVPFLTLSEHGIMCLRTVPTIVTAHTFCASGDTRVSYGWCLLLQGYFCVL